MNGIDVLLLPLRQAGDDEGPQLVQHDGQRHDQARGTRRSSASSRNGSTGPLKTRSHPAGGRASGMLRDVVAEGVRIRSMNVRVEEPPDDRASRDRDERDDQPPPELLEVLDDRHRPGALRLGPSKELRDQPHADEPTRPAPAGRPGSGGRTSAAGPASFVLAAGAAPAEAGRSPRRVRSLRRAARLGRLLFRVRGRLGRRGRRTGGAVRGRRRWCRRRHRVHAEVELDHVLDLVLDLAELAEAPADRARELGQRCGPTTTGRSRG